MNTENADLPLSDLPEKWAPVPRYEGLYEVSTVGRVRSIKRMGTPGRIIGTPLHYREKVRIVHLSRRGRHRSRPLHCVVAEAFLGPCPEGLFILHQDGDTLNNCVTNLIWGTQEEKNKIQWDKLLREGKVRNPL
jgi:hypothetical protein